jgi:hypothetical protein
MNKGKIEYRGIEFSVEWEYSPAEPRTNDDPGYPERAEIIRITHKGTSFYDFLTDDDLIEIEKILLS